MSDPQNNPVPTRLALADGTVFHGQGFGDTSPRVVEGEACFNTSLSGYQEVLSDPSYAGQIVTMTYPLIGNYGVNPDDVESGRPSVRGFVVRELARSASNHRSTQRVEQWLAEHGVLGIAGIDTRALTRRLRSDGAMDAVLCTDGSLSDTELVQRARAAEGLVGKNLVATVSRPEASEWSDDLGGWAPFQGKGEGLAGDGGERKRVVALDCGAKHNILRNLVDSGCEVTVLPYDASPGAIRELKPDGLFVSNGPGDPSAVQPTIGHLQELIGELPIFGICLGHQLLSLAMGAETFKLKFGHRGGNQPVQNLGTGKVEITSQNHGFAVAPDTLDAAGAEQTHINLNDRTVEGFRHRSEPVFAVQYHPEASPGPHDARYLFDCFRVMMDTGQSPGPEAMDAAQRARNRVGSGSAPC